MVNVCFAFVVFFGCSFDVVFVAFAAVLSVNAVVVATALPVVTSSFGGGSGPISDFFVVVVVLNPLGPEIEIDNYRDTIFFRV